MVARPTFASCAGFVGFDAAYKNRSPKLADFIYFGLELSETVPSQYSLASPNTTLPLFQSLLIRPKPFCVYPPTVAFVVGAAS